MTIVNRDVDMSGKIRIVWQMANGDSVMWSFRQEPTTEELEALEVKHMDLHLYDSVYPMRNINEDDRELILSFIREVKEHPNVTFAQYNNWLSNRPWNEQVKIRNFVYNLSVELANRAEVELSDYTELQILAKVRDWIANTPVRKIAKVVLGYDMVI